MRLLLDTHIVLRALLGDAALPAFARRALVDSANVRFVSVASLWEVAIKRSTGKLDFPLDPVALTRRVQQELRAQVLPIEARHLQVLEHLPWHHRDPFDRLICAQALADGLVMVTVDRSFADYRVTLLSEDP